MTGPTQTELRTIQRAVAEAFDEDASGALRLTADGISIRPMADGTNRWAVFASGEAAGREISRRRLTHGDSYTVDDFPA